jgi:1-deoxy-D-xylulose-5-phosphate reductoisomerase
MGGTAPAVVNAADEVVVQAFLDKKLLFSDIPKIVADTLEAHTVQPADRLESVMEADAWARSHALSQVS